MNKVLLALVVLTSLGSARPGCGPFRPERDRDEEKKPHKTPEICHQLTHACVYGCFRREARYSCPVCCNENFTLCDNGEKYDFAPCELIDPAPASSADAGPSDAPAPPSGPTK